MVQLKNATLTLLVAFLLGSASYTKAQTYNYIPDSSFSTIGIKTFIYYNIMDRLFDSKLQADGKLITVGFARNPSSGSFDIPVSRHLPNGDFDTTFNSTGTLFIPSGSFSSFNDVHPRIAFDSNGKIIIASNRNGSGSMDIMVCRIDTNGHLDPSFNGTGILVFDVNGTNTESDIAGAVDVDAQNNIWVAATTKNGTANADNDFVVAKILPNGTLDANFNSNGRKTFTPNTNENYCHAILADSNGKILIGGTSGNNMYVFRIDSTGAADPGFNTTGAVTIAFSSATDLVAMDFDNNGKIVISGRYAVLGVSLVFVRLNTNGQTDNTFGFFGKFTINIGSTSSTISAMQIQADNKIVVAGYTIDTVQASDFLAVRIAANGTLDLSFNGVGYVSQNIIAGPVNEYCYGFAMNPDESILLSGVVAYSPVSNEDAAIVKLKPVLVTGLDILSNPENTIRVYPNPFTNMLDIVSQNDDQMWLTDITGKRVHSVNVLTGINHTDVSHLPAGIYFLHGNNTSGLKLIKK